jgi:hypothetical protein
MVCQRPGDCHGLADNAIPDRLSARTTRAYSSAVWPMPLIASRTAGVSS